MDKYKNPTLEVKKMDKNEKMKITYAPTSDLIPYVNNARVHSEEQVTQIASSIKEFGFLTPIITDGENGILAGHGRVMAAKLLGLEDLPTIKTENLTEAQRKAFILADNKIGDNSSFDFELVKIEMEGLKGHDFNLDVTGFSDFELEAIGSDFSTGLLEEGLRPEHDQSGTFEHEEGGVAQNKIYLTFNGKNIQLSGSESDKMDELYDSYLEEHGTELGFITHVMGEVHE